jgi:hypothetical protein
MARRTITRLATGAVVTGIATLAIAAPASAVFPKDPIGGSVIPAPAPTVNDGWTWYEVTGGALGGIALAGGGVAAAAGLRRRNQHLAHPA